MSTPTKKLTDHKILIFDVYGTLADWESGIFNALQPLLSRYPASKSWSRKDALTAFMSVEADLQTQFPEMLYSDLLAKVHEVLEERLKALSNVEDEVNTQPSGSTLAGDPRSLPTTSDANASTSTSGTTSSSAQSQNHDEHKAFGASIQNWPIFPDTCSALHRLSKDFKLVVLSNVDRHSFRHTHALLSEGPSLATVTSNLSLYTYPEPNPNRYWHPQAASANGSKSKSPFTLILTAQDTGCYKPALGGFLAALEYANTHPALFGDLQLGEGEAVKDKALSVAQSITHDHVATHRLGMRSVWIDRQSAVTCNENPEGSDTPEKWTWRFETLGEMADAVDKELALVDSDSGLMKSG
ncbi:hypothetical protein GALMADRAFT_223170 [Galerina marginata CBS 339.88]|uniref:Uncharacterized protein n=1 Tax=Galerina marginata (strain CBS 339.88) TaxID=685588 RepID=A0A067TMT5_GALM3|nr:hypothetical protein GALMADRAFT_223170 [Galerina marginata CBS 339.88]